MSDHEIKYPISYRLAHLDLWTSCPCCGHIRSVRIVHSTGDAINNDEFVYDGYCRECEAWLDIPLNIQIGQYIVKEPDDD